MIWLRDNNDGTRLYMGMIEIEGRITTFYVQTNGEGKILIDSIRIDEVLEKVLEHIRNKKWVHEKLEKLSHVSLLPEVLSEIIHSNSVSRLLPQRQTTHNYPQILIQNIDEIGWDHFMSISEDFSLLKLAVTDANDRLHSVELAIPSDFPLSPPSISVSAPFLIKLDWRSSSTLQDVLETVRGYMTQYSAYFDILDDIDQNTIVLEPVPPVYTIPSRRIAISRSCSLRFVLNPLNPYNFCEEVIFLGPPEETSALRQNMGQRISKWSHRSIRHNLEDVLDIHFPSPKEQDTKDISNECGVCYSSHLTSQDGSLSFPDQVCSNPKCARIFHYDCLITWLQSVPTNKTSFGTIFGSCPYCQEPISAKSFK